ncbi:MAG: short-chain dehydrogenase [Candidatus Omnitrophica bacterium CG11_big_fil_rev_8_21_14_0_20_63_9]|nr:MAG: short-chain dehydrogenase [Candidatus Omnitrophica bacterium CG11_big_fil_rev_8_21_14_0_20_63_9]
MKRTIKQLSDLTGRTALLTGGAGHIGTVIADVLEEAGARVTTLDIQANGRADAIRCDLRDERRTRQAVRTAIARMGQLDILIHCAAYVSATKTPGWAVAFKRQTVAAWEEAMRVNLTAAFIMVQEAQRALAASKHGSVILFSSIYGLVGPDWRLYQGTPMANPAGYAASKGGLLELTRYLATTLAPRTRVNAISPGGIWRSQPKSFQRRYEARTPLGRMAREEDLKGAVVYLASDLSSYVTGHNLVVDGGWTIW